MQAFKLSFVFCIFQVIFISISYAQTTLSTMMGCSGLDDWNLEIKEFKIPNGILYLRGHSSEVHLIAEEGVIPSQKKEYSFILSGKLIKTQNKKSQAQFKLECLTMADRKLVVSRQFKGKKVSWFDGRLSKEVEIPYGKKVLVWAGAKGMELEPFKTELSFWVDMVKGPKDEVATIVSKTAGPMSDKGTIYYYPEGIIEIFSSRRPLEKNFVAQRTYVWAEGCSENVYPSPWPSP